MLKFFSIIILILLAIALTAFTLQNSTAVPLDLFFLQIDEASVGGVALGAFLVGGLFGMLAASGAWFKVKRSEVSAKRKLAKSEKELDSLRSNVA